MTSLYRDQIVGGFDHYFYRYYLRMDPRVTEAEALSGSIWSYTEDENKSRTEDGRLEL